VRLIAAALELRLAVVLFTMSSGERQDLDDWMEGQRVGSRFSIEIK